MATQPAPRQVDLSSGLDISSRNRLSPSSERRARRRGRRAPRSPRRFRRRRRRAPFFVGPPGTRGGGASRRRFSVRRAGGGWDRGAGERARVSCIAGRVRGFPGASLGVERRRRIENLSFLASRPASASSARDSMRVTRGQRGVTPPRPSASRHGRSSRLQFGLCLDEYRRHACRRSRSLRGSIDRERKHQEKLTRWIGHGRSPSATHPGSAPPPPPPPPPRYS